MNSGVDGETSAKHLGSSEDTGAGGEVVEVNQGEGGRMRRYLVVQ